MRGYMANIPTGFRQPRVRLRGMGDITDYAPYALGVGPGLAVQKYLHPECSLWLLFTGEYQACVQKQSLIAAGQAQIQTVPDNAVAAGYSPEVVAVAQQTATQQESLVPGDVNAIASLPSGVTPPWVWLALAGGGVLLALNLFR